MIDNLGTTFQSSESDDFEFENELSFEKIKNQLETATTSSLDTIKVILGN